VSIVVGRLTNGVLADFFHGPYIGATMFLIAGGGCLLLAIADHSTVAAILTVITFGLAGGAEIHMLAFLTSRYFGMRDYGKIYGCQLLSFYIAGALGPLVAGLMYDALGSYTLYLSSAILFVTLGPYPRFAAMKTDDGSAPEALSVARA
jgi:MFS family permease